MESVNGGKSQRIWERCSNKRGVDNEVIGDIPRSLVIRLRKGEGKGISWGGKKVKGSEEKGKGG